VTFRWLQSPPLFPSDVQHASAAFHTDLWLRAPQAEIADCPPAVARAVLRRRSEHLAGRRCAVRALAMHLGRDSVNVGMIGTGPHRVPIWPQGTIGSITHSGNYAAAAVGGSKRIRGIGIDAALA
jgi:4'-phosphopantetheinyl transferase EntD